MSAINTKNQRISRRWANYANKIESLLKSTDKLACAIRKEEPDYGFGKVEVAQALYQVRDKLTDAHMKAKAEFGDPIFGTIVRNSDDEITNASMQKIQDAIYQAIVNVFPDAFLPMIIAVGDLGKYYIDSNGHFFGELDTLNGTLKVKGMLFDFVSEVARLNDDIDLDDPELARQLDDVAGVEYFEKRRRRNMKADGYLEQAMEKTFEITPTLEGVLEVIEGSEFANMFSILAKKHGERLDEAVKVAKLLNKPSKAAELKRLLTAHILGKKSIAVIKRYTRKAKGVCK